MSVTLPLLERETVIVTGGAGFLGRHLIRRLLSENFDVVVIDNLRSSNGDDPILKHTNVTFIRRSVNDFPFASFLQTKY